MTELSFVVPVEPASKNNTRFGNGRVYKPSSVSNAEDDIRCWVMHRYKEDPLDGPLGLDVTYYRRRPKSVKKSKTWADTKPDTDNYTKLFKDALEGVLWVNDARICDERYRKFHTDGIARIEFKLWELQ